MPDEERKDLQFSFPQNCPEEILAIKGMIFGGKAHTTQGNEPRTVYLIPLSYDPMPKMIKMMYITNNYGTKTKMKPPEYIIGGIYNGLLKGAGTKNMSASGEQPIFTAFYVLEPTEKEKEKKINLNSSAQKGICLL